MQNNLEIFAERFRGLRGKESQVSFARRMGIGQVTVSQYERGDREPSLATLKQIAENAETSADYLLGLTDNPMPSEQGKGNKAEASGGRSVIADLDELRTRADQAQESLSNLLAAIDKFKKEARR